MSSLSFGERERQVAERRSIGGDFGAVIQLEGVISAARSLLTTLKKRSENLTQLHPEYAEPDQRNVAAYWVTLAAIPMVCILDFLLISTAAEYLAILLFSGQPGIILLGRLCAPIGFLVVELLFAVKLYAARERVADGGSRAAVAGWVGMGLAWAGSVALLVLASQMAASGAEAATLESAAATLVGGISVIAFILHLLVLMGGRQLRDANGYFVFAVKQSWYAARGRRANHRERAALVEFETTASRYSAQIACYDRRYSGEPFILPPFPQAVNLLFKEVYGSQALPVAGRGNRHASQPGGPTTGQEDANAA